MLQFSSHTGMKLDAIAFGTFLIPPGEDTYRMVSQAIELGYRSIDTAKYYENEKDVGRAIRDSRKKIQVTSKLWNDEQGYQSALDGGRSSRDYLGVESIDLLLVHWPGHGAQKMLDTWNAFQMLQEEGTVKYIGVSNFDIEHLETLKREGFIRPSSNQIEVNPLFTQEALRVYCQNKGMIVEGWAPLVKGNMSLLVPIQKIAEKYNKTLAQIAIRWAISSGIRVLAKSIRVERMKENLNVFDFDISSEEIDIIDSMNQNKRFGPNPTEFVF